MLQLLCLSDPRLSTPILLHFRRRRRYSVFGQVVLLDHYVQVVRFMVYVDVIIMTFRNCELRIWSDITARSGLCRLQFPFYLLLVLTSFNFLSFLSSLSTIL